MGVGRQLSTETGPGRGDRWACSCWGRAGALLAKGLFYKPHFFLDAQCWKVPKGLSESVSQASHQRWESSLRGGTGGRATLGRLGPRRWQGVGVGAGAGQGVGGGWRWGCWGVKVGGGCRWKFGGKGWRLGVGGGWRWAVQRLQARYQALGHTWGAGTGSDSHHFRRAMASLLIAPTKLIGSHVLGAVPPQLCLLTPSCPALGTGRSPLPVFHRTVCTRAAGQAERLPVQGQAGAGSRPVGAAGAKGSACPPFPAARVLP